MNDKTDEGWVEWEGGLIVPDCCVEVELQSGTKRTGSAEFFDWSCGPHNPGLDLIVKYRTVKGSGVDLKPGSIYHVRPGLPEATCKMLGFEKPSTPESVREIKADELKVIADMTVKLTELRQNECKHLCIENVAPDIFEKLLNVWDAHNE